MKNFLFAILFFFSFSAYAAVPCDWSVNWGYIDNLTTLDSIKFKLIGGQTQGSSSKEYVLNISSGVLFEENLTLINQAFFAEKQIKVNTVQCVGVPTVGVVKYIRISR